MDKMPILQAIFTTQPVHKKYIFIQAHLGLESIACAIDQLKMLKLRNLEAESKSIGTGGGGLA
jgi:hypothetical protein